MREALGPGAQIRVDANAPGTSRPRRRYSPRSSRRGSAGRAAGGDHGAGGRAGLRDLHPSRRRREHRHRRGRPAGRADRGLPDDRHQALEGGRALLRASDRRDLPAYALERPRRPGRHRSRGAPREKLSHLPWPTPASPTASPPSASSPRRSPRPSASCAMAASPSPGPRPGRRARRGRTRAHRL